MLSNFIGDSGTGGTNGLVPAPPSGSAATMFLKANGSWAVPAGGGGGITSIANEGTGSGVWDSTVGGVATLRSIKAGANIAVVLGGAGSSEIQVSATGIITNGASLGGGNAVFSGVSGTNLQFNSLASGTGISLALASNLITITNSGITSVANVTGFSGSPVFAATASGVASLRTIKAGSNVTVALGGTGNSDIIISSSAGGTYLTWTVNALATIPMVAGQGYIATNAALVELDLPAGATPGQVFAVLGTGAAFFKVVAPAGATLSNLSQTSTVAGNLTSTGVNSSLTILCVTPTSFVVLNSNGPAFAVN